MSHEVETMFSVGELPWHKLGINVQEAQTASAAIELAGMDWELELKEVGVVGNEKVDGIPIISQIINDRQAVVRRKDNKYIATVGPDYQIIQNRDCFDFIDALVGEGQAVFQTAGSLFGGRRIFITLKLAKGAKVGPDKIDKYLLLTSSHDGQMKVRVKFTPIRVVCANTLAMALAGTTGETEVRIKHSAQYKDRIESAREILGLTEEYYRQLDICFNQLLECKFTEKQMTSFTEVLIPTRGKEASTRTENIRLSIVYLFKNGVGHENIRNTKWAAYNAVTQYIDHSRPNKVQKDKDPRDIHFESVLAGGGAQMRQKAYELLTT